MFFENTTFIALDLETTGVDSKKDKIIEFAAVKIENGEVVDKLELLVNPEREIPLIAQAVTGISNAEVENQPVFEELKDQVQAFIGDAIILGHNVQFDISFLKENGVQVSQKSLDTYGLSSIFFPAEKSLALEVLSERFQIEHKYKHRALGDILATVELLKIIYQEVQKLDIVLIQEIQKVLQKSDSALDVLFSDVKSVSGRIEAKADSSIEQQLSLFGSVSTLSQKSDYSLDERFQSDLVEIVQTNKNAILEIPFQFQTAAALVEEKLKENATAVFAFYSPKLINKVSQQLNIENYQNCVVLKNATNYLCLKKWNDFLQKTVFAEHEIILVIKVLIWLQKTQTGDRDEIALTYNEYELWFNEFASNESCSGPEHQECFWHKQKEKAKEAQVVLTYQNLLLESVLPEDAILFNFESHNLEQTMTMQSSTSLKLESFTEVLKLLKNTEELSDYKLQVIKLIDNLGIFWGYFFKNLTQNLTSFIYPQKIVLSQKLKAQIEVLELRKTLKSWFEEVDILLTALQPFSKYKFQLNKLQNLQQDLHVFFEDVHENEIRYCHVFPNGNLEFKIEQIELKKYSTDILNKFKQTLFIDENLATISVENNVEEYNFGYFKNSLGLIEQNFFEKQYNKEEGQKGKVNLTFLENKGVSINLFNQTVTLLEDLIVETPGKTMMLFNSYAALEQFFEKMVIDQQKSGFKILAQNAGGVKKIKAIFEAFSELSVLLGIERSFHKEFFQSEDLQNLLLYKINFDVPGDPLINARQEKYKNAFMDFALPRSILRFKQNYLKLQNQNQSFFPLDPRLIEKRYGNYFLNALKYL